MTWYWFLFAVLLVFNAGFVCGTWLSGSTSRNLAEDLRVEKLSV